MSRTYTTTLSMSIGGDEPTWEGEATVSFTVAWGRPATGPTYSHGGLPADPDEITDLTVTHIDGEPVASREHGKHEAETLADRIWGSDALLDELLTEAAVAEFAARADAMERRWEDRRSDPEEPSPVTAPIGMGE